MAYCWSHPSRGGWIEMDFAIELATAGKRPTPHGVGGLKYYPRLSTALPPMSHPSRGGWIEMLNFSIKASASIKSHPSRGGWIEICDATGQGWRAKSPTPHGVGGLKLCNRQQCQGCISSHPSRGGWIEIHGKTLHRGRYAVPPLTGWVD